MKKALKKAQTGIATGSEQGKKSKVLRGAGIAVPVAGAIGMGIKAIKDKRAVKKAEEYTKMKQQETQRKNAEGASEFKTGGMVNRNTKLVASKKATGKVGGISKAPPKASIKKK